MKRAGTIFMLAMLLPAIVRGAFEPKPAGARNAAMGGVCAAGGSDGWGGAQNPAQLQQALSTLVGVSVTPGIFEIPELGLIQAMALLPVGDARFGLSFSRFGNDLYREAQTAFSFSTGVSGNAAIGAGVQIYHLSIAGYGSAVAGGINIGLRVQPSPVLSLAFALTNCTGSSIGACHEEIPRSFAAAVEWSPKPLSMVVEVYKEGGEPMSALWGCEYTLAGVLHIRGGCTTEFLGVSAGGGIDWPPVRLDYAWRWHCTLGATHTVSVTLEGLI